MGPLPKASGGSMHVLVLVDYMMGYLEAAALSRTIVPDVAK